MFYKEYAFNQPIDSWDVASVTNMEVRRAPPAHHRVARATAVPPRHAPPPRRACAVHVL
jgi:surface protein